MRSTPTEMQSMNENDFECLAKTRVNTPPMAKITDDGLLGRYSGPEVRTWEVSEPETFSMVGIIWSEPLD